jgi:hypothetical protein
MVDANKCANRRWRRQRMLSVSLDVNSVAERKDGLSSCSSEVLLFYMLRKKPKMPVIINLEFDREYNKTYLWSGDCA